MWKGCEVGMTNQEAIETIKANYPPENYTILGEEELRPIVNVEPNEESVYNALYQLMEQPEQVDMLSRQSIEYVHRHHDHIRVAQQYLDFWEKQMGKRGL